MDCISPGSSVHGIFLARTLEQRAARSETDQCRFGVGGAPKSSATMVLYVSAQKEFSEWQSDRLGIY